MSSKSQCYEKKYEITQYFDVEYLDSSVESFFLCEAYKIKRPECVIALNYMKYYFVIEIPDLEYNNFPLLVFSGGGVLYNF